MKKEDLEITGCANSGCEWACCSFQKKSHIIIMPKEFENIPDNERSHLSIIDDSYLGGMKVHCSAKDTATCDGGYKPVHCGIYPLWAKSINETSLYISNKCPLPDHVVEATSKAVLDTMANYCIDKSLPVGEFETFLSSVYIDNYSKFDAGRTVK